MMRPMLSLPLSRKSLQETFERSRDWAEALPRPRKVATRVTATARFMGNLRSAEARTLGRAFRSGKIAARDLSSPWRPEGAVVARRRFVGWPAAQPLEQLSRLRDGVERARDEIPAFRDRPLSPRGLSSDEPLLLVIALHGSSPG